MQPHLARQRQKLDRHLQIHIGLVGAFGQARDGDDIAGFGQLDRLPLPGGPPAQAAVEHGNIRGANYFDPPPEADHPVIQ